MVTCAFLGPVREKTMFPTYLPRSLATEIVIALLVSANVPSQELPDDLDRAVGFVAGIIGKTMRHARKPLELN